MNKKAYSKAELEILEVDSEDIIVTSPGNDDDNETPHMPYNP